MLDQLYAEYGKLVIQQKLVQARLLDVEKAIGQQLSSQAVKPTEGQEQPEEDKE